MSQFRITDFKEVQTKYGAQLKAERIDVDADGFVTIVSQWVRISEQPGFYQRWLDWTEEGA